MTDWDDLSERTGLSREYLKRRGYKMMFGGDPAPPWFVKEQARREAYLFDRFTSRKVEVFHLLNWLTKESVYLWSRELRAWCLRHPREIINVPIDYDLVKTILEDNAVDPRRVATMTQDESEEPIVLIRFGTSDPPVVMIADGRHRYVRRAALRFPSIPAFLVGEEEWRRFQIFSEYGMTREEFRDIPVQSMGRES